MPFLRFTRDKRGYETTSLVHAVRRSGRSHQQILYWFRTPPGVRVGRPALDEEAIRWIEEHNPEIAFDWPKILEVKEPAAPPADGGRARRGRREKGERRRAPSQQPTPKPAAPPDRQSTEAEPEPLEPELLEPEPLEREPLEPEPLEPELAESGTGELEDGEVLNDFAVAIEQLTHPDAEETPRVAPMPVEQTFGPEQLTRLRARFAELQARITERGGDAARIDALRAQAEPLNPDAWVTEEEVRNGIEAFEPRIRDLRAALGLRRRRRSRRGGRRRKKGPDEG